MTKKLFYVFVSLLFLLLSYLFVLFLDPIVDFFNEVIEYFSPSEIIIPENNDYVRNYHYNTVSTTTNYIPNNYEDIKKIYYTVLNNGWNKFTFYCPKEYANCSKDVESIADDQEFTSLINNYVSPYNSFHKYNTSITNNKEVYLNIERLYNEEEINKIETEIDRIFMDLAIDKNNITILELRNLHKYLISKVTYDEEFDTINYDSPSNKAYGALFYGKAVCSGYSDAYSLMLDKLNIPNFKISNDDHIWNVLKINNVWYHVDVTWDDDENNNNNYENFFLVSTSQLQSFNTKQHDFKKELYKEIN